jgi:hypothetical protein
MQGTGSWNPSVESRPKTIPAWSPLTTTAQCLPPQHAETVTESPQHGQVTRHSVVAVIAVHDTFQPFTDSANGLMHLPAQLPFDGQQFCPHSLCHGSPPYDEMTIRARPTVVGEPEKRDRFRLSLASLFPVCLRESTKLDQARFSGWISSPNFASRSRNSFRNRSASARCWKPTTRSSA